MVKDNHVNFFTQLKWSSPSRWRVSLFGGRPSPKMGAGYDIKHLNCLIYIH